MFVAAAAAHMHFLSAAAAAASFTSSLPSGQSTPSAAARVTEVTALLPLYSSASSNQTTTSSSSSFISASLNRGPRPSHLAKPPRKMGAGDREYSGPPSPGDASSEPDVGRLLASPKTTHIKKPLNAFMLFMKEMRPRVQEECTLKESAAINQILGKKWHELSRAEQTKYYEMAREAKELHQRLYPGWSARNNYAYHARRRHRRNRRPFHHHRQYQQYGLQSSPNAKLNGSATVPTRTRSISLHEERCAATEEPLRVVERPHSTSGAFSPPVRSSPVPSPLSPSSIHKVSVEQHQQQLQHRLSDIPTETTASNVSASQSIPCAVSTSALSRGIPPPPPSLQSTQSPRSMPTNSLTMSPYSAFEQHYNHHTQQLQRTFCYAQPTPAPAATIQKQSIYPGASQIQQRVMAPPTNYWGYPLNCHTPHHPHHQRNSYLAAAAHSDSVAAVAAVAAMAAGELSGGSMKKCRARFGLEHQNLWCKPCRRKKKCIRFISDNDLDDFLPHHHLSRVSSTASMAAAAAVFGQHPGSPPYGSFARRQSNLAGLMSGTYGREAAMGVLRKPQQMHSFCSPTPPAYGNASPKSPFNPFQRFPTTLASQLTPNTTGFQANPVFNAGYNETIRPSSRQQQLSGVPDGGQFDSPQYSAYWNADPRANLAHSTMNNSFAGQQGFRPGTMSKSIQDERLSNNKPPPITRELQGCSLAQKTTTPYSPKQHPQPPLLPPTNTFQLSQQGINTGNLPAISKSKTNGPFLSFGVADVMGFKKTTSANADEHGSGPGGVFRGASPSTSSCPLRSSPELD